MLAGVAVLISAGPTFEDIDPVRFIGNRSSGRMGFAIAAAAAAQGAAVTLIAGPVVLATPAGVERVDVRSAREMRDAVLAAQPHSDVFISAAAVGDYRPRGDVAAQKIKKNDGERSSSRWCRTRTSSPRSLRCRKRPFVVGFAAETENIERHARAKLESKRIDLIAANEVGDGQGFETRGQRIAAALAGRSRASRSRRQAGAGRAPARAHRRAHAWRGAASARVRA